MNDQSYEIWREGLRVLFLLGGPIVLAVAVAGAVSGMLQTVTSSADTAIGYAARVLALVAVGFLMGGTAYELCSNLVRMALQ